MATHLAGIALVRLRVVELVLPDPRLDGLRRRPVILAGPEDVLAVGSVRMEHLAIAGSLGSPSPGVPGQAPIPNQRRFVELEADEIVGVEKLAR